MTSGTNTTDLAEHVCKLRASLDTLDILLESDDLDSCAAVALNLARRARSLGGRLAACPPAANPAGENQSLDGLIERLEGMLAQSEAQRSPRRHDLELIAADLSDLVFHLQGRHRLPRMRRWKLALRHCWSKVEMPLLGSSVAVFLLFWGYLLYYKLPVKHALHAKYYSTRHFERLYFERFDPYIDFDWEYGAPIPFMGSDEFSVVWTGFLMAPESGSYEFSIAADDGAALTIDGIKVIDKLSKAGTHSAAIDLRRGYHPIKIEYFDARDQASIKLLWRRGSELNPKVIGPGFFYSGKEYLGELSPDAAPPAGSGSGSESRN